MEVFVTRDEDGNHVTIEREESDGRKVEVTVKGDDPIVVRRTEIVGGQPSTTEQTYPDMDALRAADPDAYDMLDGTQERGVIQIGPPGAGTDPRVLKLETLIELEDELDHSSDALAEYFSTLARTLDSPWLNLEPGKSIPGVPRAFAWQHEVRLSIRTQPDGQIEVTRRTGDAELTDVYRDEDDLKARDPSMYERYRNLRDVPAAGNEP
jgi:hypothetical protein